MDSGQARMTINNLFRYKSNKYTMTESIQFDPKPPFKSSDFIPFVKFVPEKWNDETHYAAHAAMFANARWRYQQGLPIKEKDIKHLEQLLREDVGKGIYKPDILANLGLTNEE